MALKAIRIPGFELPTPTDHKPTSIDFQSQNLPTIDQPIPPKTSFWKAVAFAVGLGLNMLSYQVSATPASSGNTVHGL